MNKNIKIIAMLIIVCLLVCVFAACNDKDEEVADTVNGLPKITITEGMTLDEVRVALAEVKNYKIYDVFHIIGASHDTITTQYECENGYTWFYSDVSQENGVISVTSRSIFYEDNLYYNLYVINQISYVNRIYDYDIQELNADKKAELDNHKSNILLEKYRKVESGEIQMTVEDGKIIFVENVNDEIRTSTFYDFNNTLLPLDEYVPDYKSFEIGRYSNVIQR